MPKRPPAAQVESAESFGQRWVSRLPSGEHPQLQAEIRTRDLTIRADERRKVVEEIDEYARDADRKGMKHYYSLVAETVAKHIRSLAKGPA